MSKTFDLVIVGTGPAASRIAELCADRFRIAIVDRREIGGTCALRGCNPKKVFVRAAELLDWTRRSQNELLAPCQPHIDWPKLVEFTRTFTEPVPEKSEHKFHELGIATFHQTARFAGDQTMVIGDDEIRFQRAVICSGARPRTLNIEGERLVTHSDQFMETPHLPKRILFIGGGYISFEFAHIARRAGASVRILEATGRPLAGFEPGLVDELVTYSRSIGIDIHTNLKVQAITESDDGLQVSVSHNSDESTLAADMVVHGAGRVPAIERLKLSAANIQFDDNGVLVNEHMQSVSNERVYAAGDAASTVQPKLTPVANQQGRTVALNLLQGNQHTPDYGIVPKVVFTVPSLASVGMAAEQASDEGLAFEVQQGDMSEWSSLRKIGATCGGYKIVVEKDSERLLGAHLLGPHVAETINLFALAMKFGLSARDMKSVLYAFPTFAADVRNML